MKENLLVRILNIVDSIIKFPNLKKGEIGIQIGFDLSSPNLTTDLLKMHYRVGNTGLVIGIEPDPINISKMQSIIDSRKLNIKLINKATFSKKTNHKLTLGHRSSHNKLDLVKTDNSPSYTSEKIDIEIDTLDNIIKDLNIDYSKISHINITNNGAEYNTLQGMSDLFAKCDHIMLTIASGRSGKIGKIGDNKDYEVIIAFLEKNGFKYKFIRMNESFWWGFVHMLIIKRKWVFGQKRFGVIIASKGNKKIKFYQAFS